VSAQEEENKAVIRRLVEEVYNQDDLDVLDELLAQDFVNHSAVPEHQHGIESFKHVNRWLRAGFSDAHYKIEDMIAEGDRVACPHHPNRHPRRRVPGLSAYRQAAPHGPRPLAPPGRWEAGRALGGEGRLGGGAATRPAPLLLAAKNLPTRRTS
jgi:predicted ester cyclase